MPKGAWSAEFILCSDFDDAGFCFGAGSSRLFIDFFWSSSCSFFIFIFRVHVRFLLCFDFIIQCTFLQKWTLIPPPLAFPFLPTHTHTYTHTRTLSKVFPRSLGLHIIISVFFPSLSLMRYIDHHHHHFPPPSIHPSIIVSRNSSTHS